MSSWWSPKPLRNPSESSLFPLVEPKTHVRAQTAMERQRSLDGTPISRGNVTALKPADTKLELRSDLKKGSLVEEVVADRNRLNLNADPADPLFAKGGLKAKHKDPNGGLTAEGRKYYNKTEGANLKPGVKGEADTPEKMRRKGSFLSRMFGDGAKGSMKDENGEPTRRALSAKAWGEPVPQNDSDRAKLAAKGKELLEKYAKAKDSAKKSVCTDTEVVKAYLDVKNAESLEKDCSSADEKEYAKKSLSKMNSSVAKFAALCGATKMRADD